MDLSELTPTVEHPTNFPSSNSQNHVSAKLHEPNTAPIINHDPVYHTVAITNLTNATSGPSSTPSRASKASFQMMADFHATTPTLNSRFVSRFVLW
jgi:hypothetical protein